MYSVAEIERDNLSPPEPPPLPRCPVCGEEVSADENIYTGHGTDYILGCEHCVDRHFGDFLGG